MGEEREGWVRKEDGEGERDEEESGKREGERNLG